MICLATGFEARSDVRTAVRTARAGLEPEERDGATRGGMANPTIGSKKHPERDVFVRGVSRAVRLPSKKASNSYLPQKPKESLWCYVQDFEFLNSTMYLYRNGIF